MKLRHRLPAILIGLAVTGTALPCGDKLAAIGGGIRFERVYAARHPARVALFVPGQSRLRAANEELKLAQALERAGHQVIVIDDTRDLPDRLQPDRVDLLLVDVADVPALAASAAAPPLALLVHSGAKSGAAAAKEAASALPPKCVAELSKRTSVQLLRKVDDALDRSKRGVPPACPAALGTHSA